MVLGQGTIINIIFLHKGHLNVSKVLICGNQNLQRLLFPQVTTSGQFVFPLDSPHKKPYESLVLGRYRCSPKTLR